MVSSLPGYACWRITSIMSGWVGVGVGLGLDVKDGNGVAEGARVGINRVLELSTRPIWLANTVAAGDPGLSKLSRLGVT